MTDSDISTQPVRTAYFDCFAGASGDMILGALVDVGLDFETLRADLSGLHLDEYEISASRVTKHGIAATKVDVVSREGHVHRHLSDVLGIIDSGDLPARVKERAGAIFRRLAEAEAKVHDTTIDHVHFHEVGAVDAIVDIVGAVIGFERLGIGRILTSALTVGSGTTRGAHGAMPIPVPAVVALCQGLPLRRTDIPSELVTPTGAAILTTLAESVGVSPTFVADRSGYGAGTRDLDRIPNLLRLEIGEEVASSGDGFERDEVILVETNIDDAPPEIVAHVVARLLEEGARDAWVTPVTMKKGRAAVTLSALSSPGQEHRLAECLLRETTAIGVRMARMSRLMLPRRSTTVQTEFGPVQVKAVRVDGRERFAPEYEDCARLAAANGVPIQEVYRAAFRADLPSD